jgi:tetratricopeptide (TPR) repeat protein
MYKSRLHSWGLDKKKKEHEMLEIVRQGEQEGASKTKIYEIRGRAVSLADAWHYFARKGIKDPTTLLKDGLTRINTNVSSPDEEDVRTPLSVNGDFGDGAAGFRSDTGYSFPGSHQPTALSLKPPPHIPMFAKPTDFAEHTLVALMGALNISDLKPLPAFRTLDVESVVPPPTKVPREAWYIQNVVKALQQHYRELFDARGMSVANPWTASSESGLADQFHTHVYHGYSNLYNGSHDLAAQEFQTASKMVPDLVQGHEVGFLILLLDLIMRYDGNGHEQYLLQILGYIAECARTFYNSEEKPVYHIATLFRNCDTGRADVAEAATRKLLDFFEDSIGYFHQETIAVVQIFGNGLINRSRWAEAAVRFLQLVDAFETTIGKCNYEVCYALRSTSEVYFHNDQYVEAAQALKMALERCRDLPMLQEREIYVRCLRGMAEIWRKLGRQQEAIETMQYGRDATAEAFGADHPFTERAEMHLKSIVKGESTNNGTVPLPVYRLGRGGAAANNVWTTRTSPTRLEP